MDVIERVKSLTKERGWSKYRLAKEADLAQTTIANIFNRGSVPSVATIEILCEAYGISLSEFFAEEQDQVSLTSEQARLLTYWNALSPNQQQIVTDLAKNMNSENQGNE